MKKSIALLLVIALSSTLSGSMICGCNKGDNSENEISDNGQSSGNGQQAGKAVPTSAEVVSAIKNYSENEEQNYDFTFELAGNVSLGAISTPDAHAVYNCQYRYNSSNGDLKFKRVTSGVLLYDSTEYIYSSGDSKITLKIDDKGKVKKSEVESNTEIKLINLPIAQLVNSLKEQDIENITSKGNQIYKANLKLSSNNPILSKLCNIMGKMDTSINLKGAEFTNLVNGLEFEFKMDNDEISDYALAAQISVPVKNATVYLNLDYKQQAADTQVSIPSNSNLILGSSLAGELQVINAALDDVKNSDAYSLDLVAENEMDPGWNVMATKDSVEARLYKHTANGFTHFNNSYEYNSHHETEGKEKYTYTVGNISDGTVHVRSFKGKNEDNPSNETLETRFAFMAGLFGLAADKVDCLEKTSASGTVTYKVYLNNASVVNTMKGIVARLNTNPAEGVIKVDNKFDDEVYTVKDATLIIILENGKLKSMDFASEIKYNPIEGEYTENNVTLNNKLTLKVDEKIEKANKYESPDSASKLDNILSIL